MAKRKALGKGLDALLTDSGSDITSRSPAPLNSVSDININDIEANPFQPREYFNEEELEELVESISVHGLIQPVTVRKIGYGKYQLISGERRTRAAIRAGLKTIPAYIRVADDQQMLEMSLIENIHREDLNPIEVAISYQRLIDECSLTQEEVAKRIGKNRSTVTNYLRLLKLPDEVQLALRDKKITVGHARSIINIEDREKQLALLNMIINDQLNVRDIESLAKQAKSGKSHTASKSPKEKDNRFSDWENRFSSFYELPVKVKSLRSGKGQLVITFKSEADLERIASLVEKANNAQ